jgi:hypothetical protein
MKTNKKLWKSIASALMLLVLIVMVTVSCKKKDDEPTPPVPPVPPTPEVHDVFQNKPIHMMSDYEMANKLDFPGHIINRLGNGLVGGEDPEIPNPFKKIGKTLWEIYDYKHTEMRFDQVMGGIKQIEGQLTQLQAQMNAMAIEIKISTDLLINFMTNSEINADLKSIAGVMDSTTVMSFGFYTKAAKTFQNKNPKTKTDSATFKNDTTGLHLFVSAVLDKSANYNVLGYSSGLNSVISSNTGPTATYGMVAFVNEIISLTALKHLSDTASMMHCYMLLESYFLQVVNAQFQCALVYSNACNYRDNTGALAQSYYTGQFQTQITQEVAAFQYAVDHMVLNLSDYRTMNNMIADQPFIWSGLAPDFLFPHVLARSQFITNLIYDALGLSYPVMCGRIITPNNYTCGSGSVVNTISLNIGGNAMTSNAERSASGESGLLSQFPYTTWQEGDPAICSPDNLWNVYRFGTQGQPNPSWPTQAVTGTLIDNGINLPWFHTSPISGKITTLYYNPVWPDSTSITKTSRCNMQFGYFSARWNWGFPYVSLAQPHYYRPDYLDYKGENSGLDAAKVPLPACFTTNSEKNVYPHNISGWYNNHNNLSDFGVNSTGISTSNYFAASDIQYRSIQISSSLPGTSGSVAAWCYLKAYVYSQDAGVVSIYAGTNLDQIVLAGIDATSVPGNVVSIKENAPAGSWLNGSGSTLLNVNGKYNPAFMYYLQTYNGHSYTFQFEMVPFYQVVYGGTYSLTK